ncbi:UNVERIFIED_CONTAM: hypothetical protein Cloal_3679 [Acetivibrio alkalicellulosi]
MKVLFRLKNLWLKEKGQSIVEYGLLVGLSSVIGVIAVTIFREKLEELFIKLVEVLSL